jgi:putative heme-binding domain-containing protein
VRNANAGVFRYEPRTHKFETYVNFGFANPHGHAFDRWGQDIVVDGTGSNPYHAALFSGQTDDYKQRHSKTPMVYKPRTRPCPGIEILSSGHFPAENQGNLLVGNVIGFHGILQYKLIDKGASFGAAEVEPIVSSSDPNFRPSDLKIGPDGAIYFSDWHNPIIGHMQHNLRDPNRNRDHGRIYRVTCEGRPLLKPVAIHGEPVGKLLDVLKQPEDRVRYRARIELGGRDTDQVIAAAQKWVAGLDPKGPEHEHHLLEALWLHQSHNVIHEDLLRRMLRSADYRARAAATRVLCYWRDRVRAPLELLRTQINDAHPRVRLEAIRALSFFRDEAALAVAVELLAHPDDQYLRYVFNETLNTLERRLVSGKVNRGNIAATLLQLLDRGKVAPERRPVLLDAAVRHGGAKELTTVWQQAQRGDGYPADLRRQVLGWLAEAAATRQVRPTFDPEAVRKLLAESSVRREAARLAAAWKVKEAAEDLRSVARDAKADLATRGAAIDALATLGDADSTQALVQLTLTQHPVPVRFRAAAALARVNPAQGATAAAGALAAASEQDDPGEVVEAFLTRKGGGAQLADALEKAKLPADAAKRILRSMYAAGLHDARLSEVAGKLAGLDAAPKPPSAAEVRRLMDEVKTKGDAARGERVFLRADLGCVKCHAVNRAGGHVGPDLGPIGGSSPLDYIITSILDPNASIKEEYLTKVISTTTGELVTGVVVERNKNVVVLKDGTGKLVRIPAADIDAEGNGKSLMPEGVTRILTRAETLDLICFVSELGRPGGAYPAVNAPTVRRWKRLRSVPEALREGVPNREAVRELLQRDDPAAWETVYAAPGGSLALGELRRPAGEALYLQGEVNVTQGGPVEVRVESKGPVTFWVDEEPFEKQGRATAALAPGRHRITVRVVAGEAREASLRVELSRPAGSRAAFEVVQGD